MVQFFQQYTLEATIIFLFMFGTALKQGYELVQYFRNKTFNHVDKIREQEETLERVVKSIQQQQKQLQSITDKIDELLASDKDSIKSWIVMLYKQYKKDPSGLDSMQMDLLERRFSHYKKEGGNSYIDNLMQELREIYNNKEDNNASV